MLVIFILIIQSIIEKRANPSYVLFCFSFQLEIILTEYSKNNCPIAPLLTQLLRELRQRTQPHTDEFYSLLMCIMLMLQDDVTLATEDESFLLDTIRDVMKDPSQSFCILLV